MITRESACALLRPRLLTALSAVAFLAACEARLPTGPEIDRMDAGAVESAARQLHLSALVDGAARWEIDDVEVTEPEARALPGNRIARIEVERGRSGEKRLIRLYTRADGRVSNEAVRVVVRREGAYGPPRELSAAADGSFTGILYIDGVRSAAQQLSKLRPEEVESISILKGPAAVTEYGPEAAAGVIRIVTKSGARR